MLAIQKRIEETSKTHAELAQKITEVFEMTQDLNKQQRNRVDSVNVELSQQAEEVARCQARVDQFMPSLNKCYEDIIHFKDMAIELIQNFKYELLIEQDKILRNIEAVQREKVDAVFKIDKTNEVLQVFDTKLEEYRQSLAMKMEAFDPLQYNLMERNFFEEEKVNIYRAVRGRCRDIEAKVRHLEKYIG